ncbi:hypothetical protein V7161_27000 [Neobacillus drentensis]|uniref:hypothetical protein n=1 Tax=Neobacillus drentensis TaxID=220684 RepID=UPI0030030ECE
MTKKIEDIRKILIVDDLDNYYVYGIDKNKLPIYIETLGVLEGLFNYLKRIVKDTRLSLDDIFVIDILDYIDSEEEGGASFGNWLSRQVDEKIDVS